MKQEKIILVLESNADVRFALGRVGFGPNVQMRFENPSEWESLEPGPAVVLAEDSLLRGTGEKLPLSFLGERMNCPVIVMTSAGSRRMAAYAKEAGAAAVLSKPFGAGELRREIGRIVGSVEVCRNGKAADQDKGASVFTSVDLGGSVAGEVVFDKLFTELEKRQPLEEGLDAFDVVERQLVLRALQSCAGNQSQAARFLGITRNTLRKRIKKYGFTSLISGEDQVGNDENS